MQLVFPEDKAVTYEEASHVLEHHLKHRVHKLKEVLMHTVKKVPKLISSFVSLCSPYGIKKRSAFY